KYPSSALGPGFGLRDEIVDLRSNPRGLEVRHQIVFVMLLGPRGRGGEVLDLLFTERSGVHIIRVRHQLDERFGCFSRMAGITAAHNTYGRPLRGEPAAIGL